MFSSIRRALGLVKAEEKNQIITVSGIPSSELIRMINKIAGTTKVSRNILINGTDSSLTFHSFYAVEVNFILVKILSLNPSWSIKSAVQKIIAELHAHTWLRSTVGPVTPMVDISLLKNIKWTLKPHQLEFIKVYGTMLPKYNLRGYFLAAAAGTGKALSLDTKIRIPGGWKLMRDIQVGDTVIAGDGSHTKVTGVYPQGTKPAYRMTFKDGRTATVCKEHFWKTFYAPRGRKIGGKQWDVCDTEEIMRVLKLRNRKIYIPLMQPEDLPVVKLPIHPWLLGYILGNGSISNGTVKISTSDRCVLDKISMVLPQGVELRHRGDYDYHLYYGTNKKHPIIEALRALKLMGKLSYEKFIPELYKNVSIKQRLQLIQGLMDSDGTSDVNGSVSFSSSSITLAKDFREIMWSLGAICKWRVRQTYYTHRGEKRAGRLSYNIHLRYKYPEDLFSLPRKKERVSNNNQYADNLKLCITSVEPIGDMEMQCISVDHPDKLFVIDDYIVTHNTLIDLAVAACIIPRSLAQVKIIISPKNALSLVWKKTIEEVFKKTPSCWTSDTSGPAPLGNEYYVFHYEALDRALELAKSLAKRGIKYFVAVDESHNFNEIKSQRTQNLIQLCTLVPDVYQVWASGTPVKAMSSEVIPALMAFDPLFTKPVADTFSRAFNSDKAGAMEIVAHRIGIIMFRVPTSIVMTTKPTFLPLPVTFDGMDKYTLPVIKDQLKQFYAERMAFHKQNMESYKIIFTRGVEQHKLTVNTPAAKQRFNQWVQAVVAIRNASARGLMVDPVVANFAKTYEDQILIPTLQDPLRKQFIAVRTAVKTLRSKVTGESLGKLGQIRIACINDIAQNVDYPKIIDNALSKTILFSTYTKPLDTACALLSKGGYQPVQVYGDTSKDVTKLVDYFTDTPEANPLATTYATLSTAVPVIAANTEILLDFPYRQYIMDQTVARVQRMGQQHPTFIYQCKLDTGEIPNISTRNEEILKWSESQVDTLMSGDMDVDLSGMEFTGGGPAQQS